MRRALLLLLGVLAVACVHQAYAGSSLLDDEIPTKTASDQQAGGTEDHHDDGTASTGDTLLDDLHKELGKLDSDVAAATEDEDIPDAELDLGEEDDDAATADEPSDVDLTDETEDPDLFKEVNLEDPDADALTQETYKDTQHEHTPLEIKEPTEEEAAALLAQYTSREQAYTLDELKAAVLKGMEWLTDRTLKKKTFLHNMYEITDAWLHLFPANITEVHNRVLQVMHIIKDDHGKQILKELQTEFKESKKDVGELIQILDHVYKAQLFGLPLHKKPIFKWWKKGRKALKKLAKATNVSSSMEHVWGWNPLNKSFVPLATDVEHGLYLTFHMKRVGVGSLLNVTYTSMAKKLQMLKPYKDRSAFNDTVSFEHQTFLIGSYLKTLSDYGLVMLDADLFQEEAKFLRKSLRNAVVHNNTELVGEVADLLQLMRVDNNDPDVVLAHTYLIKNQNPDGSWGFGTKRHPAIRETTQAILGLLPRTEGLWLPVNTQLSTPTKLTRRARIKELYKEYGLGEHLPPPPADVYVHGHEHDEL